MDVTRPPEDGDQILTPELYMQLKQHERLTDVEIARRFGFQNVNELTNWKKDHGLFGVRLSRAATESPPANPADQETRETDHVEADTLPTDHECTCGGKCLRGGITLSEALAKIEEVREDISTAKSLLNREDGAPLTKRIRVVLEQAVESWEAELARLENARVQLPL